MSSRGIGTARRRGGLVLVLAVLLAATSVSPAVAARSTTRQAPYEGHEVYSWWCPEAWCSVSADSTSGETSFGAVVDRSGMRYLADDGSRATHDGQGTVLFTYRLRKRALSVPVTVEYEVRDAYLAWSMPVWADPNRRGTWAEVSAGVEIRRPYVTDWGSTSMRWYGAARAAHLKTMAPMNEGRIEAETKVHILTFDMAPQSWTGETYLEPGDYEFRATTWGWMTNSDAGRLEAGIAGKLLRVTFGKPVPVPDED